MPIYAFICENETCNTKYFERVCKYEEIADTHCPDCASNQVEKQLTVPNLAFTQPNESSKWDNFGYRAGFNFEKAQKERRMAQERSHVGPNPYQDNIDDIQKGEGILE